MFSTPITCRWLKPEGSSTAHTQKLRLKVSAGLMSMSFQVPYIES